MIHTYSTCIMPQITYSHACITITTTKKGKENASNMPKRTPQERSPCHSSLSLRERPFFSVFLSKIKENMWNKQAFSFLHIKENLHLMEVFSLLLVKKSTTPPKRTPALGRYSLFPYQRKLAITGGVLFAPANNY